MCSLVACMSASYLLISVNKPRCVVCFGDCLIFAKCIIYRIHPLDQIIRQSNQHITLWLADWGRGEKAGQTTIYPSQSANQKFTPNPRFLDGLLRLWVAYDKPHGMRTH